MCRWSLLDANVKNLALRAGSDMVLIYALLGLHTLT